MSATEEPLLAGVGEEETAREDLDLMQRIAARDAAALRTLYERYSALVFAVCLRIVHDRGDAEQILIDVFADAWERSDRFDASRGSPRGYLAVMARSRAIDHCRSKSPIATQSLRATDSASVIDEKFKVDGSGSMFDVERSNVVVAALQTLSDEQRSAIELAFYEGLSHGEVAARLDRPLGTVKTHIRQGLLRMRDSLRRYWEGGQAPS